MTFYLIEDWDGNCILPENVTVVALTSEVIYVLDKKKIPHITLEDFYTHAEITADSKEWLSKQIKWFDKFDVLLRQSSLDIAEISTQLPHLFFYNIKYLIDQVVVTTRILKKFMDKAKPSKIYFIAQDFGESKKDRWGWFFWGKSSFGCLIEPLCKQYGIEFELVSNNSSLNKKEIFSFCGLRRYFLSKVPKHIKSFLRGISTLYGCYKVYLKSINRTASSSKKVFILHPRGFILSFLLNNHRQGVVNFINCSGCIVRMGVWPRWFSLRLKNKNKRTIGKTKNIGATFDMLVNGGLMNDVNRACGVNVTEVLRPKIEYLVNELFPHSVQKIQEYKRFFQDNKIDYVMTNYLSTDDDFAAVAATKECSKTESIGFCHGVDAYDIDARYFMEYCHFDHYFSSTPSDVQHIKQLSKDFNPSYPKTVQQYSYLRNQYVNSFNERNKVGDTVKKNNPEIILYVPIMRKIRLNMPIITSYPSTVEYFSWHKMLIDYFSQQKDCKFIWKAVQEPLKREDLVSRIIDENNVTNIVYDLGSLSFWLKQADRVICDVPSTAYFEAIFSGLPVLSFYRKAENNIRKDLFDVLGESLCSYTKDEDAIPLIDNFLRSDPLKYTVSIPETDNTDHIGNLLKDD